LVTEGPLAGLPFMLKDLFPLAGVPTRAGSSFLHRILPLPVEDARIVRDLAALGAVCVGKTHLHEFAYGLTGENPHYGDCDNPASPGHTTGGSSSGSAAAVAAGLVPFAIGTDTGGSVRIPSAYCGLYGFRCRPGEARIADAFPLAPSCDTVGWMTADAAGLRMLNTLLTGPQRALRRQPRGLYLDYGHLDAEPARVMREAALGFASAADRHSAGQLLEGFRGCGESYSVLTGAEAAHLHRDWLVSHKHDYSRPVWERLERGRTRTETELIRAASNRQFLTDTLASYFLTYDFLVLPAAPAAAPRHEDCASFDRTRILDLTAPASLAGLPVLSLPLRLGPGLHTGLQVLLPQENSPVVGWLLGMWEVNH
jgi:amidase/aspartyl-tRNA(Asn)/glutamyl-tRNA(Gln) amidotransferase subunit A